MNTNAIDKLARIMQQYGLSHLEVTEGETKVLLKKDRAEENESAAVLPKKIELAPEIPAVKESPIDFNNLREIKSPMVGVFYASPAPDAPPFVQKGSIIKKGDILCIIEAMKLMNEIQAEVDGEIVDICVLNGDVVEFGQTIFKII